MLKAKGEKGEEVEGRRTQEISRGQNLQNLNTMGHSGGRAKRLQFPQLSVTVTGPIAKGLCGSS